MLATRATGTAKIAPIEARTALGPNGSAVSGPSATDEAPKASALRSTAPTLPGSRTPHSATHSGPLTAPQRCSKTPSARVPEPRPETPSSSSASTSTPARSS